MSKKLDQAHDQIASKSYADLETILGKKMQVAMGLIDNVTTSTLQADIPDQKNFYEWLDTQVT